MCDPGGPFFEDRLEHWRTDVRFEVMAAGPKHYSKERKYMTYAEWKASKLKTEDLMAPNPVLCYGAGGAFQGAARWLIDCGINVVGVIDAHKTGRVLVKDREFPLLTIQKAVDLYGTEAVVIVTIASVSAFKQVKKTLSECGYDENKILDLDAWAWLTAPSEKSYCNDLARSLVSFPGSLSPCCKAGVREPFLCEWFMEGQTVQESVDRFFEKRSFYMEESKQGKIPLYCRDCAFLTPMPVEGSPTIRCFDFSDHTFCNADCVYCTDACTVPRVRTVTTAKERFEAIAGTLEKLQRENLLDPRAVIILSSGEITVNPYKEKIYATLRRVLRCSPELELQVYSNCFIYDQELAELLEMGKGTFLQCDLDAGTPESYIKVKGFNKFDAVRENLKEYVKHGTVKLKYIVMPGWNDSPADYDGTVGLLKELGCDQIMVSIEIGVSMEGNRTQVRESLYAAARLMALLERNGIKSVLPPEYWKKEYIPVLQRLCREIRSLDET